MSFRRNSLLWLLWIVLTMAAGGALASIMFVGGPRDLLLIGKTTGAHYQIELACDACHTAGFYPTAKKANKAMNKACLSCHKAELKVSNDSHPVKKFRDPRNADRLARLDARYCATCHAEHVPEVTRPLAVSLPMDYCSACHQDVGKNRPSHVGLGFDTCASAGCHNFHDNTALYEDFLVKHARAPDFLDKPVLEFAALSRAPKAGQPVAPAAPARYATAEAVAAWQDSAHARAGVNCAGCHAPDKAKEKDVSVLAAAWIGKPGLAVCQSCHGKQARTFREGKHGMRFHPKLPKPRQAPDTVWGTASARLFHDASYERMQVSAARIPMKPQAATLETGNCNACHRPHTVDTRRAVVEACASCHDDPHTRAYFNSPHFKLWRTEMAGDAAPGTGVSCADCHMPKLEADGETPFYTTHNQNAYLRPNEKMIRPVCMSCHGLRFAIDALADPKLVEANFNGRPSKHIESIDWATKRARKTE